MPACRSVREPASLPGFFDGSGVRRVMSRHRRREVRTGSARQCFRAAGGDPGVRPPPWSCAASHARITLDAHAALQPRHGGEASRTHRRPLLRCKAPRILPCAHRTRMQDLRRNVRAAGVGGMRILWRGGGSAPASPAWRQNFRPIETLSVRG
jgi:hypothetical protein